MSKLTEEEKNQWKDLFLYVEKEILDYDDNQKLQKDAVLRLKGLANGKVYANNKTQDNGNYSPTVLKVAFTINKNKIKESIRNKEFETESNKIAYICAIVRGSLNNVYEHVQKAEHNKKKVEYIDTSIMDYMGQKYKNTSILDVLGTKHEELW